MKPIEECDAFERLARDPIADIRLAEAALVFAKDHRPSVDIAANLRIIDGLAERIDELAPRNTLERIAAMRAVLVREEDFRGTEGDYYDPRNSFLDCVLEEKRGIPISLSVIWLEIADLLGWPADGIGLPGHFLIKFADEAGDIVVDPFGAGRRMTMEDCHLVVSMTMGRPMKLYDQYFLPQPKIAILYRMLGNLRHIYLDRGEHAALARVLLRLRQIDHRAAFIGDELQRAAEGMVLEN